jgi:hypothetical protein
MDLKFVNFSDVKGMRDPATKAQIRKHAMKVTGLARRRLKRTRVEPPLDIRRNCTCSIPSHFDAKASDESLAENSSTNFRGQTHLTFPCRNHPTPPSISMRTYALDEGDQDSMPWVYDYCMSCVDHVYRLYLNSSD